MDWMSTAETKYSYWPIALCEVTSGLPSTMSPTSKDVPPMSVQMMFGRSSWLPR